MEFARHRNRPAWQRFLTIAAGSSVNYLFAVILLLGLISWPSLARLVRTSATHRNIPMEVAIGIAVCPDDGTEAPALAVCHQEGLLGKPEFCSHQWP